jgi:hypothetical protein
MLITYVVGLPLLLSSDYVRSRMAAELRALKIEGGLKAFSTVRWDAERHRSDGDIFTRINSGFTAVLAGGCHLR